MSNSTISGLSEVTTPLPTDVLPVVNYGSTVKVQIQNLKEALPEASATSSGLMSPADKAALDAAIDDVNTLKSVPRIATVASANAIVIPDDCEVIVLTGGTNIASVSGGVPYKIYVFAYPSGPGVQIFGQSLAAGDSVVAAYSP